MIVNQQSVGFHLGKAIKIINSQHLKPKGIRTTVVSFYVRCKDKKRSNYSGNRLPQLVSSNPGMTNNYSRENVNH